MNAALLYSAGYNAEFLEVPLPLPAPPARALIRELLYTHFAVLLDPARRLAIATGVNIDGDRLVTVDRGEGWHLDSRIPLYEQAGEGVYARNDLDRGHLVRRLDPVWGDTTTARRANYDTFAYTNAAPQAGAFNQSKQLWLGLEDHVLTYARTNGNRISVFTAPVLSIQDPIYRGVKIPQAFWKIAAWTTTTKGSTSRRDDTLRLKVSSCNSRLQPASSLARLTQPRAANKPQCRNSARDWRICSPENGGAAAS
jgi:endonuclease G